MKNRSKKPFRKVAVAILCGIVFGLSFISANAQTTIIDSGTCGANLTWKLTNDSTLTISGSGAMDNYGSVPGTRNPWYSYNSTIKTIIIGNSVTMIGNNAFYYCGMTSIIIGSSVFSVSSGHFYNCGSLTSINVDTNNLYYSSINGIIYNKMQDILIYCPEGRTGTVIIPNSVTAIGYLAFFNSKITTVIISNSVITIGNSAFSSCRNLKSVTIPNSVTTIGDNAFSDCSGLTSITIPNSVTTIGNWAFSSCGLTSITIPNSVTTIGYGAFVCYHWFVGYYSNLTSIICEAITPPDIDVSTFIDSTIPVYVPCNSVNAYKTANYWNSFTNFIGMSDTVFIFDTICQGAVYIGNGFIIKNGAGTYYRTVITSNNCNSVICLILSEYFVPITNYSSIICQGEAYSDDNFTNLTLSGNYYDTLQNIFGCDSIVELTLTVKAYFVSDTAIICQGDSYDFFGRSLTKEGVYYETLQTINGCDSIIKLTLTVSLLPDTTIYQNGCILIASGAMGYQYQWYFNDVPIPDATEHIYTYTQNGVYYVVVTNKYGCRSKSKEVIITDVGIDQLLVTSYQLRVFPNPTSEKIVVSGQLLDVSVEIFDVVGQLVYTSPAPSKGGEHSPSFGGGWGEVDISHLSNGIYFIKINNRV